MVEITKKVPFPLEPVGNDLCVVPVENGTTYIQQIVRGALRNSGFKLKKLAWDPSFAFCLYRIDQCSDICNCKSNSRPDPACCCFARHRCNFLFYFFIESTFRFDFPGFKVNSASFPVRI